MFLEMSITIYVKSKMWTSKTSIGLCRPINKSILLWLSRKVSFETVPSKKR